MSTGNLINKLKDLNNSSKVSVFVPSAKKEMSFKQLSVKQQKDLMKTGLDGQLSGLSISAIIKDVIIENSIEKYEFLSTDKVPIILALRKQSFGDIYTFSDGEKENVIDLNIILSKKLLYKSEYSATIEDSDNKLSVELEVPTLANDDKFNSYIYSELKKKKDVELSETVGVVYVGEIAKFLKSVSLGEYNLDLSSSSPKEKISVVENFPVTFNNKILKFIEELRKEELDYATVDGITVAMDARLFANQQ
jgi:hypothetical protein